MDPGIPDPKAGGKAEHPRNHANRRPSVDMAPGPGATAQEYLWADAFHSDPVRAREEREARGHRKPNAPR